MTGPRTTLPHRVPETDHDVPAIVVVLAASGDIVRADRGWEAVSPAAGMVGDNYIALCEAADSALTPEAGLVADGVRRVLEAQLDSFTSEYSTNAGSRWIRIIACPNPDAPGGAIVRHLDVTAVVRLKGQLPLVNENFRILVENSLQGVLVHRYDELLYVNQAFADLLGYDDPAEVLALGSIDAWVPPEERNRIRNFATKRLEGEAAPSKYESPAIKKNGEVVWVEARGVVVDWQGKPAILGMTSDVTDTRLARERLEALVTSNPIASVITRVSDGTILYANGRFLDLMKIDALTEGQKALEFYDDKSDRNEIIRLLLDNGEVRNREQKLRLKNGEETWVAVSLRLFEYVGEEASFGTLLDINERKNYERHLLEARRLADVANKAKSDFLASMSHELRTPLNAVLGFSQILRDLSDPPLPPEQADHVEHIIDAGGHLLPLINGVLDLSRIETGQVDLSLQPVKLSTLVSDSKLLVHALAEKHNISLIVALGELSEVEVSVDPLKIRQVLVNVLSNGIKYNRDAGSVTVNARLGEGGMVCLEIVDTGVGFAIDDPDEIFRPFTRLGMETSNIEGTGVGLAISHELIERMGGRITFASTPGEGSTFSLELPPA
jgi:PAS domain S-box-containing protein